MKYKYHKPYIKKVHSTVLKLQHHTLIDQVEYENKKGGKKEIVPYLVIYPWWRKLLGLPAILKRMTTYDGAYL